MSGNDTVLYLPDGEMQILREDRLSDPEQLALMLEPGNFGRAFPYWQSIAKGLGIPNIRNNALTRAFLRARLGLNEPVAA